MARVRLSVELRQSRDLFPISYLDEQGRVQLVPWLRLRVAILIGADTSAISASPHYNPSEDDRPDFNATLDTGASLAVFPRRVWATFESAITRLRLNPDELAARPPDQRVPVASVGANRFTYFLGRVPIGAFDVWGRRLPAVPVLAMFREDITPPGEPVPNILLGVGGGFLDGRRLVRSPVDERYDPDLTGEPTFGQWWWLSDDVAGTS